jgi:outer membrane protein assembly factor BamB
MRELGGAVLVFLSSVSSVPPWCNPGRADEWPQFRGPNSAQTAAVDLPEKFGPDENVRWKVDLPGRGLSAPAVTGNTIFLTANSGMRQTRLHVLAFAADTGRKLWERQFWATGQTLCHPQTCMAAPTPVTDGNFVYALFGTCDLVCLDLDGNVVWLRSLSGDYPAMVNHVGRAASPVLADGVLIVPEENQGASYILGIDPKTGRNLWKAERALDNCYTTPVVTRRWGHTEVIVQSPSGLTALDPATGKTLWNHEAEGLSEIPSPVAAGDLVLGMQRRGMIALRPTAGGPPAVAWQTAKLSSFAPSAIVADGKIYVIKGEILTCGDLADGKVLWDVRLKGFFWASPILAGGKLYIFGEGGVATVVRVGAKGEFVATNDMKEKVYATPAIAHGAMYLRTDQHLYCIAKPAA